MSAYHFDGAGKYIRPMIVLLTAKACNLHGKLSPSGLVMSVVCCEKMYIADSGAVRYVLFSAKF